MRWIISVFVLLIAIAAGGLAAQSCQALVK